MPSVIVDNGQAGFSETGSGWTHYTGAGYNNNLDYAAAGTGANTASWQLSSLAAGNYDVQMTWTAVANHGTNATYSVYDGNTLLRSVTVNQQQAPSGNTVNGSTFQSLGQFQISSGTLKVTLTDNANGYVIADALQVVTVTNGGIVDNGQAGFSESGSGWTHYTGAGYSNTLDYAAAGSGANTASWQLSGLTAGTYDVQMTWTAVANHATNARYSVYDGSALLGTVTVNQQQAPSGTTVNGSTFQSLGQFPISSGTLTVTLSDNANGYVIADALRGVAVSAAPQIQVTAGSQGIPYNGSFSLSALVGQALTQTFTVTNTGTATLTLSDPINLPGGFTLKSDFGSTSLAPGNSTTFVVWLNTAQAGNYSGTVSFGTNVSGANPFQFTLSGTVASSAIVDNGQAGFSESGSGWTHYTGAGYSNTLDYAAAGSGANTASWQLSGLTAGTYDVQMTWTAVANHATNARYSVYDGSALLGTVTVNQQQAPSGTTVNGSTFQSLGQFPISSGTLTVTLSDNANGYVIADAFRLIQALGHTYYVAPNGGDSNDGSQAHPWKTLQYSVSKLQPGDTLNVEPGSYAGFIVGWDPAGQGQYGVIAGTPGHPITIQADPTAAPNSVIINAANNKTAAAIDLEPGCDYITLAGLAITNSTGTVTKEGIKAAGSNDSILNNTVTGVGGFGIFANNVNNLLIQGNTVTGTTGTNTTGHGIYLAGISANAVIQGNVIHDNAYIGIHINGDPGQVTNALIAGNWIYNNGQNGINADGLQSSIIENNLIYGYQGYGICLYHIDAAQGSTNNLIVNNTIVSTVSGAGAAIRILDQSTGNTLLNNILLGGGGISLRISNDSLSGLVSDYNVEGGSYQSEDTGSTETLAQWQAQTGQDKHSFAATAAQLFANAASNNYHLSSTSPAINKGTSQDAPAFDLDGKARPSGMVDIGAYEH